MSIARKTYIHYLTALALGIITYLLLPLNYGLTSVGRNVLVVMVPAIFLWITESNGWVSLIALGGMIIAGLNYESVISVSWGNHLVPAVACSIALTIAMQKTGVTEYIASWFYTRKSVEGNPYRFLFMFLLSLFVLSLFLNPEATAILFISLAESIMKKLGYSKKDECYTMIMLCILWICSTCEAATPIGHPLPMMMIGLIESTSGTNVSFFEWMKIGIPFGIAMFTIIMLIVRVIWKPDMENFKNLDIDELRKERGSMSKEGKVTTTVFVCVVVAWLLPQLVKIMLPDMYSKVSNIGIAIPPMIGVAMLNAIKVNGKPVAEVGELFREVPWKIVLFLITILAFSSHLSSPKTGISSFISGALSPLTGSMNTILLLIFAVVGTTVMTNFFSNGASMVVFYYLVQPLLCQGDGIISSVGLGIILCCAANLAFLMAPSSTYCALFYGEHISIKSTIKFNIIYTLVGVFFAVILLAPLSNLFYKI